MCIVYIFTKKSMRQRHLLLIFRFHPDTGTLEYVASNPEALLPRAIRPNDAVGSSGSSLMDYDFRRLRSIDNMQEIRLEALNNRVGVFAHSRGFRYQCDS